MVNYSRDNKPFSEVCYNAYGRSIIYTNATTIDETNIEQELGKALALHWKNRTEIDYLERYYKGDQPINYIEKAVRPEINNKILINHALEIVQHKAGENFGEPIQYVLKGTDETSKETKSIELNLLNDYNEIENKAEVDIQMAIDRSYCGTSYKFHYVKDTYTEDEAPFGIDREDPKDTFVVYSSDSGHRPMFSCQVRKDEKNKMYYFIYTETQTFKTYRSNLENEMEIGINAIGYIPVVEYPNGYYRLSDIEIVISILDAINKTESNRANGLDQFIQSFMKFINCEVDEDEFAKMREYGAITVKGGGNGQKVDVEIMSNELDQNNTQTFKDDLYDSMLVVNGMPDRQENSGGDTGQAVVLRNGFYFSENRAELAEPTYKKAERESIKIVLSILRKLSNVQISTLVMKDIEIKITRSKMDNMAVKAQVFQVLCTSGVDEKVALKVCNLFSDPEEVYLESKERFDLLYPKTAPQENTATNVTDTTPANI